MSADVIRHWTMKYVQALYRELNLTVIANPTVPILPPALSEKVKQSGESNTYLTLEVMKYIFLANYLGMPAYTVPIGFAPHEVTGIDLPIGFHMQALHWRECDLLRMANAITSTTGYINDNRASKRPEYFLDALSLLSSSSSSSSSSSGSSQE